MPRNMAALDMAVSVSMDRPPSPELTMISVFCSVSTDTSASIRLNGFFMFPS